MGIWTTGTDEVMTLSEAAERLSLSRRTLERQAELGRIATVQAGKGRTRLVLGSEVQRYWRDRDKRRLHTQ